ncbi:hypothetical protein BGY98DRAFT_939780 [Russula aff. rugulosa BPL654]|nr:hypothetical protein BGY98DRAFT_939780 [Russula aff. rugulosa BPL654]
MSSVEGHTGAVVPPTAGQDSEGDDGREGEENDSLSEPRINNRFDAHLVTKAHLEMSCLLFQQPDGGYELMDSLASATGTRLSYGRGVDPVSLVPPPDRTRTAYIVMDCAMAPKKTLKPKGNVHVAAQPKPLQRTDLADAFVKAHVGQPIQS